ncbi:MAG: cyclic nucleotide-binding domain-containing protein [Anaerolineales bacterium]|nr:cyclic nucleotide-binding domain-containing protein [Anaerolineales bacterium]MCX7609592.1 cyclic nucleotide-binding domain-containing protein [Anaerolineales bacterium]MDW8227718.1 cyclic nucleotide-binding domain-containing protein [Anaerolineales bacterium]
MNAQTLAEFPFFHDISPEVLEQLAEASVEQTLAAGEVIFREGQSANQLHFLLSGEIALRVAIMTKPTSVTVSYVNQPYQCFGWSGLVPPHYYTATAYCETECKILAIPAEVVRQALEAHPRDGFKIMQRIAELISYRLRNSRDALLKTL